MPTCKNVIPGGTGELCGMEIKWRYEYGKVPAGEKNTPLNPDGSPHWPDCRNKKEKINSTLPPPSGTDPESKPVKPSTIPEPELETAETVYKFDRTFKLVEITISKSRKINERTNVQINPFESLDYFIAAKIECELGTDFQRVVKEHFAKIMLAITNEIEEDKIRMVPED